MQLGSEECKMSQYAVDTAMTLIEMNSIRPTLNTINTFCKFLGMKLNVEKTGIWLGILR